MTESANSTTKLPGIHLLSGIAFFGLGMVLRENIPRHLGLLPGIQLPCAFFSAVLVPLGALLALRAIIFRDTRPRIMISYLAIGILFGIAMMSLYFFFYAVMGKVIDLPGEMPQMLPKMINLARTYPKEAGRRTEAQYAFRLYGAIIPYRLDDQRVVDYEPNVDDREQRRMLEQGDHDAAKVLVFIRAMQTQYPYLFGLYAATYFATFMAGWFWLCLKQPLTRSTS